jgi:DNA invertase Pin-like site-specific DNA recombinase
METRVNREPMRAAGYCRVSTDEQGDSGLGLASQKATIHQEVQRRGWAFETMYADVASGKSMKGRTDFARALDALNAGEVDVLIVAKLDRLSRSVSDFAAVLAKSQTEGWALNICDLGVDTTTPSGKMVAQIMMVLAEWEREMIGDRTRRALEQARAQGTRLGRPSGVSDETLRLIRILRNSGKSFGAIAHALDLEGVATGQGGQWHAATVKKLYERSTD